MKYIKDLVREIFGKEAAKDKDIVRFYKEIHKNIILDFIKWVGSNYEYKGNNEWLRCNNIDNTIYKTETLFKRFLKKQIL